MTGKLSSAGYQTFCDSAPWRDARVPRPFCQPGGPSLYSHVQSTYWSVGFLTYWTAKQLPNFLLAAPILALATSAAAAYAAHNRSRVLSLGSLGPPSCLRWLQTCVGAQHEGTSANSYAATCDVAEQRRSSRGTPEEPAERVPSIGFYADGVFVYVAQMSAMALFAALYMHVQVSRLDARLPAARASLRPHLSCPARAGCHPLPVFLSRDLLVRGGAAASRQTRSPRGQADHGLLRALGLDRPRALPQLLPVDVGPGSCAAATPCARALSRVALRPPRAQL